jgi:P27 family predicted phage terminase small subunit
MRGGRRPNPDNLVLLTGNPGKRRLPTRAQVPAKLPQCPKHLHGEARKEWGRLAPQLFEAGLLTELDVTALSALCVARAHWLEATRKLAEEGSTIVGPGGVLRASPWVRIQSTTAQQIRLFAQEFGMLPGSRGRIKAVPPEKPDPFEEFMNS